MMMPEQFSPGVLLSETHAPQNGTEGVFADAVAAVAERGFFRNVVLEFRDRRAHKNDVIGPPGALSEADMPRMLREIAAALPLSRLAVPVALEVRTPEGGDPGQTVSDAEQIFRERFAKCQ